MEGLMSNVNIWTLSHFFHVYDHHCYSVHQNLCILFTLKLSGSSYSFRTVTTPPVVTANMRTIHGFQEYKFLWNINVGSGKDLLLSFRLVKDIKFQVSHVYCGECTSVFA
jgi:hypothetical protein